MVHRRPLQRGRTMLLTCLMSVLFAIPGAAAAQDGASVIVMKFEETDAGADVMSALNESLNSSIEAHPEMHVKGGGDMTIKDLTLTAGCGQPDEACMKTLRDFIDADRVVFGSVQGGADSHLFSMKMFDFADGRFIAETSDQQVNGDEEHVREVVPAIVEGLLYGPVGALTVEVVGAESPELLIDGELVGVAPTTLENLPLGEHEVMLRNSDGEKQTETIVLRYGTPGTLSFAFSGSGGSRTPHGGEEKSGRSIVPGLVSLGIGVIGLGVGGFSSLQVVGAENDNQRLADEDFVDPAVGAFRDSDAVAAAKSADLDPEKIKKRGETFEMIQWIGYGVGAVGVGVGVALIIRAMGGDEAEASAALPFDFGLFPTSDGAAASFSTSF